jgi:glycosyltransferase involved in cell wall biosynthesis
MMQSAGAQSAASAERDDTPFFGVVIPTYNRATTLPRAIKSVTEQSFADFELIVVDDGSSDNTESVVKSLADPRIIYVRRENGGQCAARNTGAEESRAKYLVFLDDDDELLPGALERLRSGITDDEVPVSWGAGELAYEDAATIVVHADDLGAAFDGAVGVMYTGSAAIRRDLYGECGGYAEDLPCSTQAEFWLRMVPLCTERSLPIASFDEPVVRVHQGAWHQRPIRSPARLVESIDYIVERHGDRLARDPVYLSNCQAIAGVASARLGDYADARRRFASAVRTNPRGWRHSARFAIACIPPLARKVWAVDGYTRTP